MRLPTVATDGIIPAAAYDQALKEVFVSDPNFNSVEVYSTVDGHKVGEISIPGPAGLGFSPDFTKLYVGTITPYFYLIDPTALHVTAQIQVPTSALPTTVMGATEMPVMPYPMADGSVVLGMGVTSQSANQSGLVGVGNLVRYAPGGGSFTPMDPGPSGVSSNPSRTQDGKYLLVYAAANSGQGLLVYSATSQTYLPPFASLPNFAILVAANFDGSQFASVQSVTAPGTGGFNSQVNFWGPNLQAQAQYLVNGGVSGAVYSRDGKYLYLTVLPGIVALNTQTGMPAGYAGLAVGADPGLPTFLDVDETYHLIGVLNGGACVLNASQLQTTVPPAMPEFVGSPTTEANPNVGPLAGGTQVQFIPAPASTGGAADGISSTMEAYFGSVPATSDTVAPYPSSSNGGNFLTATAPAAAAAGPVSVLLTDSNNNTTFLPDAFTYGPHILRVEPNTASPAGSDRVTIFAYGLGFFDLPDISVTIGGAQVDMSSAALNSYSSGDYPEQSVTISAPPGTPGWADVVLTTSNGKDTLKHGLQYLAKEASLAGGPYGSAVYDPVRNVFYLTGSGNSVTVFNVSTQALGTSLTSSAASANAILGAEALTPDSSKLLVVDPADQRVIVFDLVAGTSTAVKTSLAADPANTLVQPVGIVTAANSRAFVSVTPCVTYALREIDLATLAVTGRADVTDSCAAYVPYPEYGSASADGSAIIYAGSSGQEFGVEPSGPEYIWSYNATSDAFSGPVIVADTPWLGGYPAMDADGGVRALAQGVMDQRSMPLVPIAQPGFDARLNETGSVLYSVGGGLSDNGEIVLSDTHNGQTKLLLEATSLPPPPVIVNIPKGRPLAVDATGGKILLATQSGLYYYQLGVIPLAVGTLTPATAAAGAMIQLRGSGFVTGTTAMIGGQAGTCTFVDSETLSCTVPALPAGSTWIALTNPDGQMYSFENAFVVQ